MPEALDSRKSPARIACRFPHLALTVSTPRRVGLVHHVVVIERAGLHEFAGDAPLDPRSFSSAIGWADDLRRHHREHRPQPLPPAMIRCEAISLRYGSGVPTDSISASSIRRTSSDIPGKRSKKGEATTGPG